MACGGNFVSISVSVLCALRGLVVECSVPEAQSFRRSLQFDLRGQASGGFFPYCCSPAPSYVVEGIFVVAVLALILGGFCLGSFVYHLLSGRGAFACQTLPWARQ